MRSVELNILEAISRKLECVGFETIADNSPPFWRRPFGEGVYLAIGCTCERKSAQEVKFRTAYFVQSCYVTEVEHALSLSPVHDSAVRSAFDAWQTVLTAELFWLVLNGSPPKELTWWSAISGGEESAASTWWDDFLHYGGPFLASIDRLDRLIHWILHLDEYPHRTRYGLTKSSYATEYAAILLHYLGRTEEALRELHIEEQVVRAKVAQGRSDQRVLDATLRTNEHLMQFFRREAGDPVQPERVRPRYQIQCAMFQAPFWHSARRGRC